MNASAALTVLSLALTLSVSLDARGGDAGMTQRPETATATARAGAPIDLTGYWVSVVTQDWRWRMVVPAKGDYESIPITLEAKRAGDAWDPARDEAAGEQCKAYGAPGVLALPTRLHITWLNDDTLKVEIDTGTQTRLFHFGDWKISDKPSSRQGESIAVWEGTRAVSGGGSLKVVTTKLMAGYLRK